MQAHAPPPKEIMRMREIGKKIHRLFLEEADLTLAVQVLKTGTDITQSPNFRFLKGEEIGYSATNPFTSDHVDETWIRVMRGSGVTVLPLIEYDGEKGVVLIFKPQPSVQSWSIELVSGGVIGATSAQAAALVELQQETGLSAGRITTIPQLANVWHAPHRLNTTDAVVIAEDLSFAGRISDEKEETPISPFIATWKEVRFYLEKNVIKYAMSIAALTTYFLFHALDVFKQTEQK